MTPVGWQVVEMSNGQQLEMVDGSLIEIRPATIALDDGEIVGHRILDYELSRQVVAGGKRGAGAGPHAADFVPGGSQGNTAQRGAGAAKAEEHKDATQEELMRRHRMREDALNQQAQSLSERDKAVNGKQQQVGGVERASRGRVTGDEHVRWLRWRMHVLAACCP